MVDVADLLSAVDDAFAVTGHGLEPWPDPHAHRSPSDDEYSRVADAAGVMLDVGDPAVCVAWLPDCGCDACDSGSQNELDELDRIILGVVSGTFRRLTSADRNITQFDANGWRASRNFRRGEVSAVLSNPVGWHEVSGAAWTGD